MVERHDESANPALYGGFSLGFFLLLAVLVVATFRQYGVSWDEEFHKVYGELVYRFYATVFDADPDLGALTYRDLYLKGGFFDVVGYFLNGILPFGDYENLHLWNAVVGVLGVVGCWKAGQRLGGHRAALFSAITLTLIPMYYGHMFNNTKDIPFAAGYIWAVYYLVRAFRHFPDVPLGLAVRLGVAIGLALAVRVGGLILFAYLGLGMTIFVADQLWRKRGWTAAGVRQLVTTFVVVFVIAYGLMLLFWPYAAANPFTGAFSALKELSSFDYRSEMLYRGETVVTSDVPWSYLPHYLLIQLPEFVLGLLALGTILGLHHLVSAGPDGRRHAAPYLFLTFVSAFPVAYIIYQRSTVYDAARHVLFVVPPLACLAGLTADHLVRQAARRGRLVSAAAGLLTAAVLGAHLVTMIALHPYQYVYFNRFVGGLAGAAGRYETDYWAESYREAVLGLVSQLQADSSVEAPRPSFVYVVRPWTPATYYFPPNLVWTREIDEADFAITFTRYGSHLSWEGSTPYLVVQRLGVPLSYVFASHDGSWAGGHPAGPSPALGRLASSAEPLTPPRP